MELYFAYGTTQRGFTHHRRLASLLGEPIGRFTTVDAHAVVVPREAACSNPGCEYVHRMAMLVPGFEPLRVEGDLFLITAEALAVVDRLETTGPYVRAEVAVAAGDDVRVAHAYHAREPSRWTALVANGAADALPAYPPALATIERFKPCCEREPGHPPPHDVVEVL